MNCPKCDYSNEDENELRLHSIYHHQFLIPQCSTEVAKQNNIDYELIRKNYQKQVKKLNSYRKRLSKIPKWKRILFEIKHEQHHIVEKRLSELPEYKRKEAIYVIPKYINLKKTNEKLLEYIRKEGIHCYDF